MQEAHETASQGLEICLTFHNRKAEIEDFQVLWHPSRMRCSRMLSERSSMVLAATACRSPRSGLLQLPHDVVDMSVDHHDGPLSPEQFHAPVSLYDTSTASDDCAASLRLRNCLDVTISLHCAEIVPAALRHDLRRALAVAGARDGLIEIDKVQAKTYSGLFSERRFSGATHADDGNHLRLLDSRHVSCPDLWARGPVAAARGSQRPLNR
mmetsp:Transcript_43492/g.70490  ORF Transcript_43492/g.70490 Transcript_43492/m.70490 type:complete len:210 (-) Transcript_43492:17-646(-)